MDLQLLIAIGIIAVALVIIILWRTADARYGKVRPNRKVTKDYECFRVESHLAYYISGSEIYPSAIIGIDKTWNLDSDLWKPRDLCPREMRELVQNMRNKSSAENLTLLGFDIFDHHGGKIGNCFSMLDSVTTVKIIGERTVVVYTPSIDTDRNF
jgi:hypothetical protein